MGCADPSEIEVIGHKNFKETLEELFGLTTFSAGISIFAVVGPPGAGKSRFLEELEVSLAGPRKAGPNIVELFHPFLCVECVTQGDGYFLWTDWYIRALEELDEPCIDKKRWPTPEEEARLSTQVWPKAHTKRDAALRLALENALHRRRVKWLGLDEAHVLTYIRSTKQYLGQLESLKSLANTSGAALILVGTYGLLDLLNLNSQLRRRTHIVHLAPYYPDIEADMEEFVKTLRSLLTKLQVKLGMDFKEFATFMFTNTQGCIGAAHDIVKRAAALARTKKSNEISMRQLSKFRLDKEDLDTLIEEIRIGRERFEKSRKGDKGAGGSGEPRDNDPEHVVADGKKKKRRGGKVGRRNPVNDPVLPGNKKAQTSQ